MFKAQVEPLGSGSTAKWSTFFGVILWSKEYRPEKTFVDLFYNNMEKVQAELLLFSVEKTRALHLTSRVNQRADVLTVRIYVGETNLKTVYFNGNDVSFNSMRGSSRRCRRRSLLSRPHWMVSTLYL